jgi:hypothetical protein
VAPEVPPDLGRHLEDDELVRPGREPAVAAELPELARDGDQRVGSGLMSQVIQLRTGNPQPRPAPPDLPLRDPHQQPVQADQHCLALLAGTGERPQPLG